MLKKALVLLAVFGLFLIYPRTTESQTLPVNLPPEAKTDSFIIQYKPGFSPDDLQEKIAAHNKLKQTAVGRSYLAILSMIEPRPEDTLNQLGEYDRGQGISRKEKLFANADPKLRQFYTVHLKNPSDREHLKGILNAFVKQGFIQSVTPEVIVHPPATTPNDTYFPQQWNLTRVAADQAWDLQKGNTDIIIANIDSGVDYNHPDMNNANIIRGYNYIQNNLDPKDEYGHGTSVAGIIGAITNNGEGVAGISWNMKLMAIKMYDANGSGTFSYMDQGIVYATDHGAKIINLEVQSLSGYPCPSSEQTAIDYARSHNVIVIVPAGNYNGNVSQFDPPSCNGVIVVGATDESDHRAVWGGGQASNYGAGVAVSAPGINTYAPMSNPCNAAMLCYDPVDAHYQRFGGTSGAAPHVVGAVALMLAQNPDLTQDQIKSYLINNGDTITTDQPIGPRLNIYRTLQAVIADMATPTPDPTPIPTFILSGKVYIDANANGVHDAEETYYDAAAVDLSGASTGSTTTNSSGDYQFTGLYAGTYTVTLTVPGGYTATTTNPVTQSVSSNTLIDFGIAPIPTEMPTPTTTPLFSITGIVFTDINMNGNPDDGETLLTGAGITLSGNAEATTATDGSGAYAFGSLPAGNYNVTLTVPDGYAVNGENPVAVILAANSAVNFGLTVTPTTEPTPIPTATPIPTSTPVPTTTPVPTITPMPSPTTTPAPNPTSQPDPNAKPPNIFAIVPDYNFPPGFASRIMAGPHLRGIQPAVINGGPGAEGAEAIISPQAVHDDVTVTVSHVTPYELLILPKPFPWMQGINTAGEIYKYQMTAAFNGMEIVRFDKPVTIVVPYDPNRLWGVNVNRLRIVTYNAKTRRWQFVPAPVAINTAAHTIATTTYSFSYFGAGYLK